MTVRDFLTDVLDLMGVISAGETPADSDIQLALRHANRLLDAWNADRFKIWSIQQQEFTLTSGQGTYTIGDPTGATTTLAASRPTAIQTATIILASVPVGRPLDLLTAKEWGAITEKTIQGHQPTKLYYDYGFGATTFAAGSTPIPAGTIYLWPVPIDANTKLDLYTWAQLSRFGTLDDVIVFPPAYEQALMGALALRLFPAFQMPVDQVIAANAGYDDQILRQFNVSILRAAAGEATTLQAPEMAIPQPPPAQQ